MANTIKNYNDRLVTININSNTGDKVRLNLPIEFIKKLIKNAIGFHIFINLISNVK